MRLRFKATPALGEYHGPGLDLLPGQEADVLPEVFMRLTGDFPNNFEAVISEIDAPPKDKQLRRSSRIKVK